MRDLSIYRDSYPLLAPEDAHWTDSVVQQGHADYCDAYGHADARVNGRCARCGDIVVDAPKPRVIRELRAEGVNPARPYSVTDADTGETLASGVTYSHALNIVYARRGRYRVMSLVSGASELFDYSGED